MAHGACLFALCCALDFEPLPLHGATADLILHGGKVVTVDAQFSIHQGIAISAGRILATGSDAQMLQFKGPKTELIPLAGRMVIPGLIDSHTHPTGASMTDFDHPVPTMETIADVLDYIAARAKVLPPGHWIHLQQVFITRLREQRYPTRAELDRVAPAHPVLYSTGPDASLNSLAMKLSGIDRNFKVIDGGTGFAERDPQTGEPTGILRNCTRYVKVTPTARTATAAEQAARIRQLFSDYNSVGITGICDRNASLGSIELYRKLRDAGELTVRIDSSHAIGSIGSLESITASIRSVAQHPLCAQGDDWVRIIGIKMFLDGGMLTGSAYLREPWGVTSIWAITDPAYRGVLFIPKERLKPMVRAALESGLQFTAHSVGDGAVHTLLEVYDELAKEGLPVRQTRASITHCNFMSREAVETIARLGVVVDIQPAWLYLDTHTLLKQFGSERLRWFQPLKSLFAAGAVAGGGSDHMQKIGSMRSNNPYNPFLGMQTTLTRRAKWHEGALHPQESLTREQALRFYTINNAKLLRKEDRLGSLESGKLADLVVLDTDLLTCPVEKIVETRALRTYVGGKLVYRAGD